MTLTPEQMQEIWDWYQERKTQQISYPLDPVSEAILEIPASEGAGSTAATQVYSVSGGAGGSITGPKAYAGSVQLRLNGDLLEFPYIAKLS